MCHWPKDLGWLSNQNCRSQVSLPWQKSWKRRSENINKLSLFCHFEKPINLMHKVLNGKIGKKWKHSKMIKNFPWKNEEESFFVNCWAMCPGCQNDWNASMNRGNWKRTIMWWNPWQCQKILESAHSCESRPWTAMASEQFDIGSGFVCHNRFISVIMNMKLKWWIGHWVDNVKMKDRELELPVPNGVWYWIFVRSTHSEAWAALIKAANGQNRAGWSVGFRLGVGCRLMNWQLGIPLFAFCRPVILISNKFCPWQVHGVQNAQLLKCVEDSSYYLSMLLAQLHSCQILNVLSLSLLLIV